MVSGFKFKGECLSAHAWGRRHSPAHGGEFGPVVRIAHHGRRIRLRTNAVMRLSRSDGILLIARVPIAEPRVSPKRTGRETTFTEVATLETPLQFSERQSTEAL
jgi:hypothetical protein